MGLEHDIKLNRVFGIVGWKYGVHNGGLDGS